MKKFLIAILSFAMLFSFAACGGGGNKNEPEKGTTLVYDFELGIFPVGMSSTFGALNVNENKDYVKSGARSLELCPASDGNDDPFMYVPLVSNVLGVNYGNGDKLSKIKFDCYSPKAMTVKMGLYFDSQAGKRSLPTNVALKEGWNEVVYELDHPYLAALNNMQELYGFYLIFGAEDVTPSENVKLYIDDIYVVKLDKALEYDPILPELEKDTGDVLTFGNILYGVFDQESSGRSEWYETFEGATGVVKINAHPNWPWFRNRTFWTAAYDKDYYDGYTHIAIRAYATGTCNAYWQLDHRVDGKPVEYVLSFNEGTNTGRWVDFISPIDTFITYYDDFNTNGQFMTYGNPEQQVYIDSIRAVTLADGVDAPTFDPAPVEGDEVDITADSLATVYEGVNFTYYVNGAKAADPTKYVPAAAGVYSVVYEGVKDGKLIRGEYSFTALIRGEEVDVPDVVGAPGESINIIPAKLSTDYGDIDFTFTVDGRRVIDPTAYTAKDAGRYTVRFEGRNAQDELIYGTFNIFVGNKDERFADVMTYDSATFAPNKGDYTEAQWLSEYEGAKGVLKMRVGFWKGYMNEAAWRPMFGADVYKDYKFLSFRVRVEGLASGQSLNAYFKVEGSTVEQNAQYALSFGGNTGGWKTINMPISILINNIDGFAEKMQWVFLVNPEDSTNQSTANAYIYVDGINAVNPSSNVVAAPGASVNLLPDGVTAAGNTFTVDGVSVSDPANYIAPMIKGRYAVEYSGEKKGQFNLLVGDKDDNGADIFTYDAEATSKPTFTDNGGTAVWHENYQEKTGVLQMSTGDWHVYMNKSAWTPIFDAEHYENYSWLEFRVCVTGLVSGNIMHMFFKVEGGTSANGKEIPLEFNANTDGWIAIYMPITNFINNFDEFATKLQYLYYQDGSGSKKGTQVYVDSVRAVKEKPAEPTVEPGTILDFVKNPLPLTDGGSTEAGFHAPQWFTDADAKGYLKLNVRKGADQWTTYADTDDWLPAFDKNYYVNGGYDKIEFRVKVEGLTAESGSLNVYYGSGGKEFCLQFSGDTDGWITIQYNIAVFIDNYDTVFNPSGINFNSKNIDGNEVFFYIDYIKAIKTGV